MEYKKIKLKGLCNGRQGYVNDHKHGRGYTPFSTLHEHIASQILWIKEGNLNCFFNTSSGFPYVADGWRPKNHSWINILEQFQPPNYRRKNIDDNHEYLYSLDFYSKDFGKGQPAKLYMAESKIPIKFTEIKYYRAHDGDIAKMHQATHPHFHDVAQYDVDFLPEIIGDIEVTLERPVKDPYSLDFPQELEIKSFNHTPPDRSENVIVATTDLPFYMIKDGEFRWQINHSPFYILERKQRWQREKLTVYEANSEIEEEFEAGLSTEIVDDLERETTMTIRKDLGITINFGDQNFQFGSLASTIEETLVTRNLWKRTSTTSKYQRIKRVFTRTYPERTKVGYWVLLDEYTLRRYDGSILRQWEIRNPNYFYVDSFPKINFAQEDDYIDCRAKIEISSFSENGMIEFKVSSRTSDYHQGRFEYNIDILDLETMERSSSRYREAWGPTAG